MPLEGTLDTLSLSSLIQAFCLERKQLRLILTTRADATGELYFAQGEIIHAASATLNGEAALYQLLTWPEARFRTTSLVQLPPRTINQRWDQLLLEGMRLMDEDNRQQEGSAAVTLDERRREEEIEEQLLGLLARLEQLNQRLRDPRTQRNAPPALECLAQMVNQTLEVFHELAAHPTLSVAMRQSLAQVLAPHLAQMPCDPTGQLINAARLVQDYQDTAPAEKAAAWARAVQNLSDVIAYAYFGIVATFFRSPDLKAQWTEAYNIFFAERQHSLRDIQP